MNKPTIILDFDGVINSYKSGWRGAENISDPPTDGAKEAIAKLRETYLVVVVSSRCAQPFGFHAIQNWLYTHDIVVDEIRADKPPHVVVVDDRAYRFEGDWDAVIAGVPDASIPWNKKVSNS